MQRRAGTGLHAAYMRRAGAGLHVSVLSNRWISIEWIWWQSCMHLSGVCNAPTAACITAPVHCMHAYKCINCNAGFATTAAHLPATSKGLRVAASSSLLSRPQNCLTAPVGYVQPAGWMDCKEPAATGGMLSGCCAAVYALLVAAASASWLQVRDEGMAGWLTVQQ
jgi:hypothetical protein